MLRKTLIGFIIVTGLAAGPALSDDRTEDIVRQLHAQGYKSVDISRTFLGRTRIVATKGLAQREIVVNPRTGQILRDLAKYGDNPARSLQSAIANTSNEPTGKSTSASSTGVSAATSGDNSSSDGDVDGGGEGGDGGGGDSGDGGSGGDGGGDGGGDQPLPRGGRRRAGLADLPL